MSQRTIPCRKAMRSDDSDAADGQPLAKVAKRCMVEDDDINSAENPLSQELTRTGSEISSKAQDGELDDIQLDDISDCSSFRAESYLGSNSRR